MRQSSARCQLDDRTCRHAQGQCRSVQITEYRVTEHDRRYDLLAQPANAAILTPPSHASHPTLIAVHVITPPLYITPPHPPSDIDPYHPPVTGVPFPHATRFPRTDYSSRRVGPNTSSLDRLPHLQDGHLCPLPSLPHSAFSLAPTETVTHVLDHWMEAQMAPSVLTPRWGRGRTPHSK